MPRAVTQINGQDVVEVINESNAQWGANQDPDSQWNAKFMNIVYPTMAFSLAPADIYNGDTVNVTYDDGTEEMYYNYAEVVADISGITDGEDFYAVFCTPSTSSSSKRADINKRADAITGRQVSDSYPEPSVVDNTGGTTSGYFLTGDGYDGVAVLALTSFAPLDPQTDAFAWLNDFQETVSSFLDMARQRKSEKLVIDLTSNGGGLILAPYELFAQVSTQLIQLLRGRYV